MSPQLISRNGRVIASAMLMLIAFSFAGCGPAPEPVGVLSGSVTSGDELIGDCKVAIYNAVSKRSIAATVDSSGSYRMQDIPLGEYEVWVYPKATDSVEEIPDPRIPMKYRSGKTSGLEVSISSTDEVVYNIDLK
ncbi:carboxypeptidase-like regulatory domain-containing protein [Mariniblastus fucicola]|nr:carboxypeptidase-like regulatory domain-containing protein [Mariniblastus fucicola]